jgi:class IV lanthipeptide synthase
MTPDDHSLALCRRWMELCIEHLPWSSSESIWRYSRNVLPGDPSQGWKIHLSATVLTANEVLEKVSPFLRSRGTLFKAPNSLLELGRLNSGIFYGYTQIGKFMTVYPQSDEEAVFLAEHLHEMTAGMIAPLIPFDMKFRPDSCVYYRYGAFERLEFETPEGARAPGIRNPEGVVVPDLRNLESAKPEWAVDPFLACTRPQSIPTSDTPLKNTFRAYRALTQRGKGGVYEAVDLSVSPPRLCILKEGRRGGEMGWDGRDGAWRVRHENKVINTLREAGVDAPQVFSSFEAEGNSYLVTERLDGETLAAVLRRRRRRLPLHIGIRYGLEIAKLLSRIHSAGWAWRDCKPTNIFVTKTGLRPLDFEGACLVSKPDHVSWGTPGFTMPERPAVGKIESAVDDDLYALGVTIYLLLTGRLPAESGLIPIEKLRRGAPPRVSHLVSELILAAPLKRPGAQSAADILRVELETMRQVNKSWIGS